MPPPVERRVMPTVMVVLLAEGWPIPCHIMCTASAGVTAGVLVAVGMFVGVLVDVAVGASAVS